MNLFRYDSVKLENAEVQGAEKIKVRWLITKDMGAPNFAMRVFEVGPAGFSPLHKHPWEHEVFILEGEGQLFDGETTNSLKPGDVVFVHPDEMHQFKNSGDKILKFICLIPHPK